MNEKNYEINKLKIERDLLFAAVKNEYEKSMGNQIHYDIMVHIAFYCGHICDIYNYYGSKAYEIEVINEKLEELQDTIDFPKWRVCKLIMKNMIEASSFKTDSQKDKAARFLTKIDDILSKEQSPYNDRLEEKKLIEEKYVWLSNILHPYIKQYSFQQFRNGHYREAVLNSIISLCDLLRERTGLKLDGNKLITKVFSLNDPFLIISENESESGQNEQQGFMNILIGAFTGIRNPNAHSIKTDLTEEITIEYLILASLLARRIIEARLVKKE